MNKVISYLKIFWELKMKVFFGTFFAVSLEFSFALLASLLPIIIGSLIASFWSDVSFNVAFKNSFTSGEVFLYTSAFLAPYFAYMRKDGSSGLIRDLTFWLFLYAIFIGALLFSFVRLETILNQKMKVDDITLLYFGYSIVATTIIVWYISLWPKHRNRKNIPVERKKQMDKLEEEFDARLEQ